MKLSKIFLISFFLCSNAVNSGSLLICNGDPQIDGHKNILVNCKDPSSVVNTLGQAWISLKNQKSQFENTCYEAYSKAKEIINIPNMDPRSTVNIISQASRGYFARCNMGLELASSDKNDSSKVLQSRKDILISHDCKTLSAEEFKGDKYVKTNNFDWAGNFELGNLSGNLIINSKIYNQKPIKEYSKQYTLKKYDNITFLKYDIHNNDDIFIEWRANSRDCVGEKTKFVIEGDKTLFHGVCTVSKNTLNKC